MATKEHKRSARGLIEGLESRLHAGPPIHTTEITSAHAFLRQCSFSPTSDYFSRLAQIQSRLAGRVHQPIIPNGKRNYGGKAADHWMQVQSIHDHIILSTCHNGEFNLQRGRVKLSHRFNSEGRIDFVELKFLRSLSPWLTGEIRKLVLIKGYQNIQKDWHEAEAFTLRVLPQELVFLFGEIFRHPKSDILTWLVNIGHRLANDLLTALSAGTFRCLDSENGETQNQLCLSELREDRVATSILKKSAVLESAIESSDDQTLVARYHQV
jgi:hypothetical protein